MSNLTLTIDDDVLRRARIRALEQSVYEIQKDQQELKDEIRALVEEIKAK